MMVNLNKFSNIKRFEIFLFLITCCFLASNLYLVSFKANRNMGSDFLIFYESGHAFNNQTNNIYYPFQWSEKQAKAFQIPIKEDGEKSHSKNLNPPTFSMLMSYLSQWGYSNAYFMWAIFSILSSIIGLILLQRGGLLGSIKETILASIYLFGSFPFFINLLLGQLGSIVFVLTIGIWLSAKKNKKALAGILLGCLCSFKFFVGLLGVLFLLRKEWRLLAYAIITFLFIFFLAYPILGAGPYYEYLFNLKGIHWFEGNWNGSLYGFLIRIFDVAGDHPLFHAYSSIEIFYWGSAMMIGYLLIKVTQFSQKRNVVICSNQKIRITYNDFVFGFYIIAMLLLSPLGWVYYYAILLLPILILLNFIELDYKQSYFTYFLLFFAVLFISIPSWIVWLRNGTSMFYLLSYFSCYFYALVLLGIIYVIYSQRLQKYSLQLNSIPHPIFRPCIAFAVLPSWLWLIGMLPYAFFGK